MAKRAGKLARRYAQAFLSAARNEFGEGQSRDIYSFAKSLNEFSVSFQSSLELQQALLSPMFAREDRRKALQAVATSAGLSAFAVRLLNVIFERDRLAYLSQILESFFHLAEIEAKIVAVDIVIARPLSDDEQTQVEATLARCIDGSPQFSWSIDPEILGGMIVRYDGKVRRSR